MFLNSNTSTNLLDNCLNINKKKYLYSRLSYNRRETEEISTEFRLFHGPDGRMISGQTSRHPAGLRKEDRKEAEERRREKIIENFWTARLDGTGMAENVLAGRLAIKQRARAKYLHKSVLPCAAREELIHPHRHAPAHADTCIYILRVSTGNDVTRVEIWSPKRKCRCPLYVELQSRRK